MRERASSILEAIAAHAQHSPEKPAIGDKSGSFTYAQLWDGIRCGAGYLHECGIKAGDCVVIRALQKAEYMTAVFSVHLLGGCVCPVEKGIRDDRIAEIMDFMGAEYYITDKEAAIGEICNIRLKEFFLAAQDPDRTAWEGPFPDPEAVSEIIFTTGTTGKSKGIEVTFDCNTYIAENVIDSVSMSENEVELITTPLSHSLAIRRTYAAMYLGSTVIFTDGFKFANSFYRLLDSFHVSAITFVPAILEQVLAFGEEQFAAYDGQLNYIQLGSANLSEDNKARLRRMFPNVRLYNTYGATESGCTLILEFSKYPDKPKCIGRKTVHTEVLFVDDGHRPIEVSPSNPGLLAFRGGMNMKGYHREPEITAQVLDENGIVYTNDLGYPGEDGLVYLIGRQGDVINMGGIKIAPTEIEEVAMRHPMVADCACIPVEDAITGEAPKMFVQPAPGTEFDPVVLSRYLLQKLEALKVPKQYEVIDKIPRTFNGKIIRKDLKNLDRRQK